LHEDGIRSLLPHRRERRIDLTWPTHQYSGRDFDACGSARKLNLFTEQFRDLIISIPKSGDAAHGWQHVAEEFDALAMQF
jgi:hypothetical protein